MLKYTNWINLYQEVDSLKKEEVIDALTQIDDQVSSSVKSESNFLFLRIKLALLKRKMELEKEESLSMTTYSFQIGNKKI